MPPRKKRLAKQKESLQRRLDEHIKKVELDIKENRPSLAHHLHEIDIFRKEIKEKTDQLNRKKRRKERVDYGS